MKYKLDKWTVRWTETQLNCTELQVQRALVSGTKTSWRSVTAGAAQGQIRPNSSIYHLGNRTDGTSARWQARQNPDVSDEWFRGASGIWRNNLSGPHRVQSGKQLGRKWPVDHGEEQAEHEPARRLCTQEGQQHPGLHQEEHHQQAKRLIFVFYSECQWEHVKKMEPGSFHWCPMTGQEVTIRNHFRKFHLNVRKTLLLCQRSNTGTGYTEKFSIWKPQPWRYSNPQQTISSGSGKEAQNWWTLDVSLKASQTASSLKKTRL